MGGHHHNHDHIHWSLEPWIAGRMLAVAVVYAAGFFRLRRNARSHAIREVALFYAGLGLLALAVLSPLHSLGTVLLTAHMIEHEIMMVAAAPLLVASRPAATLMFGLPKPVRMALAWLLRLRPVRLSWRAATDLASATMLHAAALWVWHVPDLFEAAGTNEAVHTLQHAIFLGSALLFWSAVMDRIHRRYGQGYAALALFFMSLQAGALGALLTLSPRIWYELPPGALELAGLSPLEDQVLAGLIMWVPACSLYVAAALGVVARWLSTFEAQPARQ
ncbi:MAG TPA: cytochrome c oxidase assembly protein [Rhizobiaceae bacterium]|nr:cytochrome c oxidase assembly protein [Rhizobiaceae bacterium]